MKRISSVFVFLVLLTFGARSQSSWPVVTQAIIDVNGDTLAVITLPEYVKYAPPVFKNAVQEFRFNRLVRNVKKTYPYARLASIRMMEYENQLLNLSSEYEKRELMKKAEDKIRLEFEDDLKKLTFTQGWILLKLIDRETGYSTYDIVKEFRGKIRVFFWQTFASIFGFDLKIKYDPDGEDKDIELIVRMIETGSI
ncbi:MAG: DUF4294 domain-containing protein [Bacteroidales bacterium]|jgi:hypothetical protein|nr:DUF4294 domain-containing protein [Bacteroidales bacterium]